MTTKDRDAGAASGVDVPADASPADSPRSATISRRGLIAGATAAALPLSVLQLSGSEVSPGDITEWKIGFNDAAGNELETTEGCGCGCGCGGGCGF